MFERRRAVRRLGSSQTTGFKPNVCARYGLEGAQEHCEATGPECGAVAELACLNSTTSGTRFVRCKGFESDVLGLFWECFVVY